MCQTCVNQVNIRVLHTIKLRTTVDYFNGISKINRRLQVCFPISISDEVIKVKVLLHSRANTHSLMLVMRREFFRISGIIYTYMYIFALDSWVDLKNGRFVLCCFCLHLYTYIHIFSNRFKKWKYSNKEACKQIKKSNIRALLRINLRSPMQMKKKNTYKNAKNIFLNPPRLI